MCSDSKGILFYSVLFYQKCHLQHLAFVRGWFCYLHKHQCGRTYFLKILDLISSIFAENWPQCQNVRHLKFRCVFVCLSHFFPKSPRRQIGRRFTDVDTVPGETPCFLWPLTQRRRTGRRRVVDSSLSKQWSFHTAAILAGSGEVNTGVPHDTVQGSVPFRKSQTHREPDRNLGFILLSTCVFSCSFLSIWLPWRNLRLADCSVSYLNSY